MLAYLSRQTIFYRLGRGARSTRAGPNSWNASGAQHAARALPLKWCHREPSGYCVVCLCNNRVKILFWYKIMVAMVASASGYGTLRRFLSAPDGQEIENTGVIPSASVAVSVSHELLHWRAICAWNVDNISSIQVWKGRWMMFLIGAAFVR